VVGGVVGGDVVAGTVVGGVVVAGKVVGGVVGATVGGTVGGETVVGVIVVIGADDGIEADALTTVETGSGKVDVATAGGRVVGDPKLDDPAAFETDTFFGGPCGDVPCGDETGAGAPAGGIAGVDALRAVFASADLPTGLMNETVGTGDPLVSEGWLSPDEAAELSSVARFLLFDVGLRVGFAVVSILGFPAALVGGCVTGTGTASSRVTDDVSSAFAGFTGFWAVGGSTREVIGAVLV
jgi:hypothetical protein